MQANTISKTAMGTAAIRAAHQLLDDKPLLLDEQSGISAGSRTTKIGARARPLEQRLQNWLG